jgi:hypothetical protein
MGSTISLGYILTEFRGKITEKLSWNINQITALAVWICQFVAYFKRVLLLWRIAGLKLQGRQKKLRWYSL